MKRSQQNEPYAFELREGLMGMWAVLISLVLVTVWYPETVHVISWWPAIVIATVIAFLHLVPGGGMRHLVRWGSGLTPRGRIIIGSSSFALLVGCVVAGVAIASRPHRCETWLVTVVSDRSQITLTNKTNETIRYLIYSLPPSDVRADKRASNRYDDPMFGKELKPRERTSIPLDRIGDWEGRARAIVVETWVIDPQSPVGYTSRNSCTIPR